MRVASIDIGTNTVLLLIVEIRGRELRPLVEVETIARLGEGLQRKGLLSGEAMERGFKAIDEHLKRCRNLGVGQIFAVGTSALREARNSGEFLQNVNQRLGLSIDIISGEEEAHLSFVSVAKDLKNPDHPILVVDVGGGSTEFVLGREGQSRYWVSLPMGSVRFTEEFLLSDPVREKEWDDLTGRIRALLSEIPDLDEPVTLVAVGGTATTLASVEQRLERFLTEKIHHFVLTREALGKQILLFKRKKTEDRRSIPGLAPARADVILAGGTILYLAMEKFKSPSALISCHGIRYGLLYQRLNLVEPVG
jgi:exopolyphosphatase / guanosine-5'-triphosphate,3'-diphosphate pyrophosphatase